MALDPDIDPEKVACWICGVDGVRAIEVGMLECRLHEVRWRATKTTNGKPGFIALSPRYFDHSRAHWPSPG